MRGGREGDRKIRGDKEKHTRRYKRTEGRYLKNMMAEGKKGRVGMNRTREGDRENEGD